MSATKLGQRDSKQTSRTYYTLLYIHVYHRETETMGLVTRTQRGKRIKGKRMRWHWYSHPIWYCRKNFIPDYGKMVATTRPSNEPIPLHPFIWSISGMKQHWHVSRDRTLILLCCFHPCCRMDWIFHSSLICIHTKVLGIFYSILKKM